MEWREFLLSGYAFVLLTGICLGLLGVIFLILHFIPDGDGKPETPPNVGRGKPR